MPVVPFVEFINNLARHIAYIAVLVFSEVPPVLWNSDVNCISEIEIIHIAAVCRFPKTVIRLGGFSVVVGWSHFP